MEVRRVVGYSSDSSWQLYVTTIYLRSIQMAFLWDFINLHQICAQLTCTQQLIQENVSFLQYRAN